MDDLRYINADEVIFGAKTYANIEISKEIAEKIIDDEDFLFIYYKMVNRSKRIETLKQKNAPDIIVRNEHKLYSMALADFDELIMKIEIIISSNK